VSVESKSNRRQFVAVPPPVSEKRMQSKPLLETTAGDWLEDFERVTRASLSAQAAAVEELDAALCPMEADPKKFQLSVHEARRRRAMLEALREQCSGGEDAPLVGQSAVAQAVAKVDESYHGQDTAIQVGLVDGFLDDEDDAYFSACRKRRRSERTDARVFLALAFVLFLVLAMLLYGKFAFGRAEVVSPSSHHHNAARQQQSSSSSSSNPP